MDRIVNSDYLPCEIDESHWCLLAESFQNRSTMRSTWWRFNFLTAVNPDGATYNRVVDNVDGKKFLKDGYSLVVGDEWDHRNFVKNMRNEDGMGCTLKPLRMSYAFCVDGRTILPAQAIKLSKIAKISTTFVRRGVEFTETTKSILNYMKVYDEDYYFRFVDVRIVDIMDNTML